MFSFTDKSSLCSDVGGSKSLSTLSMVAAGGVGGRLFACRWPTPVISCKRRQLELTKRRPYRRPVTYNKTRITAEYINHMITASSSSSSVLIAVVRSLLYDTALHARRDYAGLFSLLYAFHSQISPASTAYEVFQCTECEKLISFQFHNSHVCVLVAW